MSFDMNARLTQLTASIVSAYVANCSTTPDELLELIRRVFQMLADQSRGDPMEPSSGKMSPTPAVPRDRSVFPDYIICLEDGKKYRMLKRHLLVAHQMTPEEYREWWGLPSTYPMVAPALGRERSAEAKKIRLGRERGDSAGELIGASSYFRSW